MPKPALLLVLVALVAGAIGGGVRAQTTPLFETRGVWLSPALHDGDWPPRDADAAGQAEALREVIRSCRRMGLNTVVFQVIYNGDAFFASGRLPWSPGLRGAGLDPGFDPLAVAVDEAHRLGMELHAWINVFWVGDLSTLTTFRDVTAPSHVAFGHPAWVRASGELLWLDPSLDAARAWMVDNVVEVVDGYDVDAVHFDYVRYPAGGFATDAQRFAADPRGFARLDDWRRDNVTRFVRDAAAAVRARKPWVRVAATPIGNYEPSHGWPALWGYSDVYQESRRWLVEGWVDYLAPQLYWSLGTAPEPGTQAPSPDFGVLVREWTGAAGGRPVFAGIAAYKPAFGLFAADDLPRQIDAARAAGAQGTLFFRYDHLMQYRHLVGTRFPYPALPAPSLHRPGAAAPSMPGDFEVTTDGDGRARLAWDASAASASDPLRGYAVFRRSGGVPDTGRAEDLYAVVDAATTTFVDPDPAGAEAPSYYRVAALSRLGVPSGATASRASSSAATAAEPMPEAAFGIVSVHPNPSPGTAVVAYTLDRAADVRLEVFDLLGRRVAALAGGWRAAGRHEAAFDGAGLPAGVYVCVLSAGGAQDIARVVLAR